MFLFICHAQGKLDIYVHRSAEGTKAEVDWEMAPKLIEICHLSAHLFHFLWWWWWLVCTRQILPQNCSFISWHCNAFGLRGMSTAVQYHFKEVKIFMFFFTFLRRLLRVEKHLLTYSDKHKYCLKYIWQNDKFGTSQIYFIKSTQRFVQSKWWKSNSDKVYIAKNTERSFCRNWVD